MGAGRSARSERDRAAQDVSPHAQGRRCVLDLRGELVAGFVVAAFFVAAVFVAVAAVVVVAVFVVTVFVVAVVVALVFAAGVFAGAPAAFFMAVRFSSGTPCRPRVVTKIRWSSAQTA